MPKIIFLWTDIALFALLLTVLGYAYYASRSPALRATWGRVARNTPAMCSAVVLLVFVVARCAVSVNYRACSVTDKAVANRHRCAEAAYLSDTSR